MITAKDERFPGLDIFPCFWQQACNKKNDFYENVIIHSKTRVGVTMKNSSLVDTLSRNNRSIVVFWGARRRRLISKTQKGTSGVMQVFCILIMVMLVSYMSVISILV